MRLGFAVKVVGAGGLPSHDTRRWQSGPSLEVSLDRLEAVLAYCVTPKIHYSTPKTAVEERRRRVGRRVERRLVLPQPRADADMIDAIAFEHFLTDTAAGLDFDVMLEAKAKDLALLALRAALGRGLQPGAPARHGAH